MLSDSLRLRQILTNLLANAIKFSSGQGRRGYVALRVERIDATQVRFTVADNGIGIAPEAQQQLFQPFVQAEIATTRRFGGAGLGLAICQRLIESFGGHIQVDSKPGRGAAFIVTLPVEPDASAAPLPPRPDLAGLRSLIVAQKQTHANDWRTYLEHANMNVEVVADHEAAGQRLLEQPVEQIVLVLEESHTTAQRWRDSLKLPSLPALVSVESAGQTPPSLTQPGSAWLGGQAMTRNALLSAIALATGRAALEAEPNSQALLDKAFTPLDRNEALAQGRLILVAEDNEVNQKVIRRQLALLGLAADLASSGQEALQMWRKGGYALLFTDLHMPEMDGYELASRIRGEEDAAARLPIIALTANALKSEARRCYASGIDDYLTKPATLDQLEAVLEKRLPLTVFSPASTISVAPAPPDEASSVAPLDTTKLLHLVGADLALADEFLRDFQSSAEEAASQMRRAVSIADWEQAAAVAHRLKSSSRAMGALPLSQCCGRLERAGKATDSAAVAMALDEFETQLSQVLAIINHGVNDYVHNSVA